MTATSTPTPIPAKAVLAMQRRTNTDVARGYGCTAHYVGRIVNGWEPASKRFRVWLSGYLDRPEHELFDR